MLPTFLNFDNRIVTKHLFNEKNQELVCSFANAFFGDKTQFKTVKEVCFHTTPQLLVKGALSNDFIAEIEDITEKNNILQIQFLQLHWGIDSCFFKIESNYLNNIDERIFRYGLKPYYCLAFTNFTIENTTDYLYYKTYRHLKIDLPVHICLVDLTRFTKSEEECKTTLDQWLFCIKNASKISKTPSNIKDKGLKQAYQLLKSKKWNQEKLADYHEAATEIEKRFQRLWEIYQKGETKLNQRYLKESPPKGHFSFFPLDKKFEVVQKPNWQDMKITSVEPQLPSIAFNFFRSWTESIKKIKPDLDLTIENELFLVENLKKALKKGLANLFYSEGFHTQDRDWAIACLTGIVEGNLYTSWEFEYITKQSEGYKQFVGIKVLLEYLRFDTVIETRLEDLYKHFLASNTNLADIKSEVALQDLLKLSDISLNDTPNRKNIKTIFDNLLEQQILKLVDTKYDYEDLYISKWLTTEMVAGVIEENEDSNYSIKTL